MEIELNTIGPISLQDWRTMQLLKGSLEFYKGNNQTGKYNRAISKEEEAYKGYLDKYKGSN